MAIYAIPASSIVNKLNIMSYNSACTIKNRVTVVHSIYSPSVHEPVREPGTMNPISIVYVEITDVDKINHLAMIYDCIESYNTTWCL